MIKKWNTKRTDHERIFSHDLLNNLHQIQLFASLAKKKQSLSELNIILQEAWHAIDLVKKFQAGEGDQAPKKLRYQSAKTFIQDAVDYFSSRGVTLQVKLDDQLEMYEVASHSGLMPIFSNLVQNINRHSKNQSTVWFKVRIFNEYMMVSLKNEVEAKGSTNQSLFIQKNSGLESIKRACQKFGGKVRFEQKDNYFLTRLYIPIKSNCPVSQDFAA